MKQPWALKMCVNASYSVRKWQRDVNSGENMLNLLYHRIEAMMNG
jgi:hypothetical protein